MYTNFYIRRSCTKIGELFDNDNSNGNKQSGVWLVARKGFSPSTLDTINTNIIHAETTKS